jgi:selenocysteine lyase/cysteine desulfurase
VDVAGAAAVEALAAVASVDVVVVALAVEEDSSPVVALAVEEDSSPVVALASAEEDIVCLRIRCYICHLHRRLMKVAGTTRVSTSAKPRFITNPV